MHWKTQVDANDVEVTFDAAPSVRSTQNPWFPWRDEDRKMITSHSWRKLPIFDPLTSTSAWTLSTGFRTSTRKTSLPVYLRYRTDSGSMTPIILARSKSLKDVHLWHVFRDRYYLTTKKQQSPRCPKYFIIAINAEGVRRAEKQQAARSGSLFGQLLR